LPFSTFWPFWDFLIAARAPSPSQIVPVFWVIFFFAVWIAGRGARGFYAFLRFCAFET
jgi:hypothetical protein